METGLDGQDGGARGCARFQCLVGVCSILERKALIDVNAHLSRSHHLEQLVRGSFERIASLYVVEEDWARQKQRTLLRQQNGRNGIDGKGLRPPGAGAPDPTRAHRHRLLSSSEPRDRPSAEFGSHGAYGFPQKHELPNILMQDGKFHHFIILTIMVPFTHDSVIRRKNASASVNAAPRNPSSGR